MLSLTYLGVAGWHLAAPDFAILIDPYVTRLSLLRMTFGRAVPDTNAVARYVPPADAVLVTHPHYDHIMDVPEVVQRQGIPAYASAQGCELLTALGVNEGQQRCIAPGDRLEIGPFSVEVYESRHRTIFGQIPAEGPLADHLRPPLRSLDYRIRQQFSFRIAGEGLSVLVASGIDAEPAVPADVVLVGADANSEQLTRILDPAQPRLVMPNHWDDMFRALDKPPRPMIHPPRQRVFIPRRIDLDGWATRVRSICPAAHVMIPVYGQPIDLTAALM
jgi:L-ascorbate metabolism protein UlaG (beta-lactamase superfamily)